MMQGMNSLLQAETMQACIARVKAKGANLAVQLCSVAKELSSLQVRKVANPWLKTLSEAFNFKFTNELWK